MNSLLIKIGTPVRSGEKVPIGRSGFSMTAPNGTAPRWQLCLEGGLNNPSTGYKWLPANETLH